MQISVFHGGPYLMSEGEVVMAVVMTRWWRGSPNYIIEISSTTNVPNSVIFDWHGSGEDGNKLNQMAQFRLLLRIRL